MSTTKTILILGGYGNAGYACAKYLYLETECNIIIAGRNIEKAIDSCKKLAPNSQRLQAKDVDASNKQTLLNALKNVNLLLVCSNTTEYVREIAEAALEANVDYLDIYYPQEILPTLKELKEQIIQRHRIFITQAGYHPGLPSALIRHSLNYLDTIKNAEISFALKFHLPNNTNSVEEIIDHIASYQGEAFSNGAWHKSTTLIQKDFGPDFGKKYCMPFTLDEMHKVVEENKIKTAAVYAAGFNWFVDYFVFSLALFLHKVFKKTPSKFLSKLLIFGVNTFTKPPLGAIFKAEFQGTKDKKTINLEILTKHHDAYEFTAIPVVATIKQYLQGNFQPGLHYMGHIVETKQFFKDMAKMGVKTTVSSKAKNQ